MSKAHLTIPPFPDTIDRDAFGHYLSGFTDGEGCFRLAATKRRRTRANELPELQAFFGIGLRADDLPVLRLIQSFWGCGGIYLNTRKSRVCDAKPCTTFIVRGVADLMRVTVPHFIRYPLRAKKAADFRIWEEGVRLAYAVSSRSVRTRGHCRGTYSKWTDEERARFLALVTLLRQQRVYDHNVTPDVPTRREFRPPPTTLFDGLPG